MKNELPDGWKWKKLGDIADVFNGKTPSKEEQRTSGHPILKIKDIDDNGAFRGIFGSFVDNEFFEKNRFKCLKGGDTLILNAAHNSEYVGSKNCLISTFEDEVIPTGEWLISRSNSELLDNRFKHYLLTSQSFKLKIKSIVKGIHLYPKDVQNLKVPLPPLETQYKIVAILEKAEETKKLRAQADELSQQLLQSVFLEMFGDPVKNPKGWNTKKLKDLCLNIYGGGTPSKSKLEYYDGEIPWVTPKDMKQDFIFNSIDHISEDAVAKSSTKIIPYDSLLMVIRSGILKKKLPVAINTCDVTLNQDMKGFVFNKSIANSLFMLYYFKSYQKYLLSRVRSVTADNLEFQQIKNIDVILPQIELQNRFAVIVEKAKQTNDQQIQSSQEIDTLFNALMQNAFTGELVS